MYFFQAYQKDIVRTRYGDWCVDKAGVKLYLCTGLASEVGEVCNIVKKASRDNGGAVTPEAKAAIKDEIGDVLWYLAELATATGIDLEEAARENVTKVTARLAEFQAREKAAKTEVLPEVPVDYAVALYFRGNFTGQIPGSPFNTRDFARSAASAYLERQAQSKRDTEITLKLHEIPHGNAEVPEPSFTYSVVGGRVIEATKPV